MCSVVQPLVFDLNLTFAEVVPLVVCLVWFRGWW